MSQENSQVMLTMQGIMVAVDTTMVVIVKEMETLDKLLKKGGDEIDHDTYSSVCIYRQLIGLKLDYCKKKAQSVLDSMLQNNFDRNSQVYLACQMIVNRLSDLIKENEEKFVEVSKKMNKIMLH